MTLAVDLGRKATKQTKNDQHIRCLLSRMYQSLVQVLTCFLLVATLSYADNNCKQFGPRSVTTEHRL